MTRMFKIVSVLLIIGLLTMATGCYGSFPLVTKVYKWNGTLGNKWVNEAAFLALNIIPVYSVASFIDAVILNSVEFWTGEKPMSASIDMPDRQATFVANEDGSLTFTSVEGKELTVKLTETGAEVRDEAGTLVARSVKGANGVTVFSADGQEIGTMTNGQIASVVNQ